MVEIFNMKPSNCFFWLWFGGSQNQMHKAWNMVKRSKVGIVETEACKPYLSGATTPHLYQMVAILKCGPKNARCFVPARKARNMSLSCHISKLINIEFTSFFCTLCKAKRMKQINKQTYMHILNLVYSLLVLGQLLL